MEYGIIADSCCDLSPEMQQWLGAKLVPLTLRLGEREFVDDETLNLPRFMEDMKACKEKISSAAPSPRLFQKAMEEKGKSFVITLSSQLSGSYASAMAGKMMADEKGIVDTHVFDSKSASAGQTLIAIKLRSLLMEGLQKEQIIQSTNQFIDNMKTYFVLERYDNLQKNGRLSRITGTIAKILNIKLLMGDDGNGNIALHAKPRGTAQMVEKLMTFIRDSGKKISGESIVISHCNNGGLAEMVASEIKRRFDFGAVYVVPTGGLSSLYADDKGVVLAF